MQERDGGRVDRLEATGRPASFPRIAKREERKSVGSEYRSGGGLICMQYRPEQYTKTSGIRVC